MPLPKSATKSARTSLAKFMQRRSSGREPASADFNASASFHKSTSSTANISIHESTHALAIHAADDRKKDLQDSLPVSLLKSELDCIAPFQRDEITLGPLLGSGEFANVYEIQSFQIKEAGSGDIRCGGDPDGTSIANSMSAKERKQRLKMKEIETYRQTKNARYALKHLKGCYLKEHSLDAFIQAAG